MALKVNVREVGDVTILDLSGKITLPEGSEILRDAVYDALRGGARKIILNLAEVTTIDSAGLGQMVSVLASAKNNCGMLKLLNLMKKVEDLLVITKLFTVFDVEDDEARAIASFSKI